MLRVPSVLAVCTAAMLSAGAAAAQEYTPPGCHWAAAYDNPKLSQLWCPAPDGSMQPTGRTAQWQSSDFTAGCPQGQYYDGRACVSEATLGPPPRPDAPVAVRMTPGSRPALALTGSMDRLVALDAQSWAVNTYDRGSMHDVGIVSRSPDGAVVTVVGRYTYNRGAPGWVRARLVRGQFTCVEFHDFAGHCRTVGNPDSRGVLAAAILVGVAGALASGSSGGSGSYSSGSSGRRAEYDPPPPGYRPPDYAPAPPVTPIGGDRGLYGADHSCCGAG